ncbi:MAG: PKD domain-containing protein [Cytophagaceae bacterium]
MISIFIFSSNAQATHIVGADIGYTNVGPNTFEFTLNVYRDCGGIPVQPSYWLDYASVSCNLQGNFMVTRQGGGVEISPNCPTAITTCNGGQHPGIEKYVYKGVFTLPQTCTDWVFSWRDCNRNGLINTIKDPLKECLYIEATLNNVIAPDNSSPVFTNDPVSFVCVNQVENYSNGFMDRNQDLVQFSSVTPKTGKGGNINYLSPYSPENPLATSTGFTVNPNSGQITYTPTTLGQITVIAIVATEYRNGQIIGSVMRDMQILTRDCNNQYPVLSGIDGGNTDTWKACPGQEICFSIFGSDPNVNQKLTMNWDAAIPEGKFEVIGDNTRTPVGNFCWQPVIADGGRSHYFTVTLRDDFCPLYGQTIKTYKIDVAEPLNVVVPDTLVPCNTLVNITPKILSGDAPFRYRWSSGVTTATAALLPGAHWVEVTDAKGCSRRVNFNINTGLVALFEWEKLCFGDETQFIDKSFTGLGNIIKWSWNFGDPASGANNTSTLQNPTHTFTAVKSYQVKLTVEDDKGCVQSYTQILKVCDIPQPDFYQLDSCQYKFVPLRDNSKSSCGIIGYTVNWGNGIISTGPFYPPTFSPYYPGNPYYYVSMNIYTNPGTYDVTLTLKNENGCVRSVTKPIIIHESPVINIIENDYYFDCSKPDTVLHAIHWGGHGKRSVLWSTGERTDSIKINAPGIYLVTVTDEYGCDYTDLITVYDPLSPQIDFTPYCEQDDDIHFFDNSFTHWGIKKWEWEFGDGNVLVTEDPSERNPVHNYLAQGRYPVKLTVTDNKTCKKSIADYYIFELPDNEFHVSPGSICLGSPIEFLSPNGRYIDSLVWTFGNGDTLFIPTDTTKLPVIPPVKKFHVLPGGFKTFDSTYTYTYGMGQTFYQKLDMFYNTRHTLLSDGVRLTRRCKRTYIDSVYIYPALVVSVDSVKNACIDTVLYFYASQKEIHPDPGNLITDWRWDFYYQDPAAGFQLVLVDSAFVQFPVKSFKAGGNYFAQVRVKNGHGCEVSSAMHAFPVIALPDPVPCPDKRCSRSPIAFFYLCNENPEVTIDKYTWDFGDGGTANVREPFHIYADSGNYLVHVKIENTSWGCTKEASTFQKIYLPPKPDFYANDTCIGKVTKFTDMSESIIGGTISSWSWDFGDGSGSNIQHPQHIYADTGTYQVKLYVESTVLGPDGIYYDCSDSVSKYVYVSPNPQAGFTYVTNELVTQKPIKFTDESIGGVKWLWYFGDGDSAVIVSPMNSSPEHTYKATVKEAEIIQIVYNSYNCTDTARAKLNLQIYLTIPNAFSPNKDNNNDNLFLIYKGIEELLEFKIYNRWGEKVFDAEGNLNAMWDGTFRGEDQPIGVYVYYVKGRSYLKDEIVLSGKLTLIR